MRQKEHTLALGIGGEKIGLLETSRYGLVHLIPRRVFMA